MSDGDTQRTLGDHGARIRSLEKRMGEMADKVDEIHTTVTQAKGGWRTFLAFGGFGTGTGLLGALISRFWSSPPPPPGT